ncbi:MAG: esterase family protein [Bacteroidales bacterium]|nr:esterase family protein [Bacteroidales bacterium]
MSRLFHLIFSLLIALSCTAQQGRVEVLYSPTSILSGVSSRVFSVYLPPSYDASPSRSYPVLYLLHGGGESHSVWQRHGRLAETLDSLISSSAATEMIVVCPEANEVNMMYFNAPHWRFEDYFFSELIPYVESHFRALSGRRYRALAGFSMGGGAAVVYGTHRPALFSMVYDISGYLRRQPLAFLRGDPSAEWRQQVIEDNNPISRVSSASPELVDSLRSVDWIIAVGDHDFTLESNMDFVRALRSRRIDYQFRVSSGVHDWRFVRPNMIEAIKRASRHFNP